MRVAVLSLTRDRLDYTIRCFTRLWQHAGCDFDHYVFDNGSKDGTQEWLLNEYPAAWLDLSPDNAGISRGLNALLDRAEGYDWYVKFDNDCELTTDNTLKDALQSDEWILSPHIQGLNEPPPVETETIVNDVRVGVTPMIGGIFMAVPGTVFNNGYRYDENNPVWGMDDVQLCSWFKGQGGQVGYMLDYPANHYETTEGQKARYPEYWLRKQNEFNRSR